MDAKKQNNLNNPTYSESAILYERLRPKYPCSLYNYILELTESHHSAWDVACGTGQVSTELSKSFNHVIASDPSEHQLELTPKLKNVKYIIAKELIPEENQSMDLITCATAIHWMNRKKFFKECDRLLKPNGLLAIWGYTGINLNPELDKGIMEIIQKYFLPYYPDKINIAFNQYQKIDTPYNQIETPKFHIKKKWELKDFIDYFNSFSAMQEMYRLKKFKTIEKVQFEFSEIWGEKNKSKEIQWNFITHFSRKPKT